MPSMWSIFLMCAERKIGNPWKVEAATMINMNQLNHVVTPTYAVLNHVHAFIHINHHSQARSPSTCLFRCQDVHLRSTSNLQTLYAHAEHCSSCCVCSLLCTVINYHLLTSDDALALPLYPCLTRRQDSRCKINAVFSRCKPNASIPC